MPHTPSHPSQLYGGAEVVRFTRHHRFSSTVSLSPATLVPSPRLYSGVGGLWRVEQGGGEEGIDFHTWKYRMQKNHLPVHAMHRGNLFYDKAECILGKSQIHS